MSAKPGRSYFYPNKAETPITPALFELGEEPNPHYERAMQQLRGYVNHHRTHFAGYQSHAQLDFTKRLADLLDSAINNIGDSFANPALTEPGHPMAALADGYFSLNAKWMERAVLDYFARKWKAGYPRRVAEDGGDGWEKTYWGYVLSMGSTEGNLMAIRGARDYLKGRRLLFDGSGSDAGARLHYEDCDDRGRSEFDPVLIYSAASHYSVRKLAQMLEFEAQPAKADEHGRMDLDDLVTLAKHVLHVERRPLAVLFNYGTTWTGALDDVEKAVERLKPELKAAGMDWRTVYHDRRPCERRGFWFHVDGALGSGYATWATRDGAERLPEFDFGQDVQSIVVSGHKWPGAPWPTGIYMTQNRYMLTNDVPAYVGSLDSTLAGSRSGIAPIFLWDWLARGSDANRREQADRQLALARSAHALIRRDWDPNAKRAPGSLMVVFKKPGPSVVHKYALATSGDQVHLVCMPHVKESLVTTLIADMKRAAEDGAADWAIDDAAREGY